MNDKQRIQIVGNALDELFRLRGIKRDEETLRVWCKYLADIPPEIIVDAIERFIQDSDAFPTPKAVRKYAGVYGLSAEERGALLWNEVVKAVGKGGIGVEFSDPYAKEAVRRMGGLQKLCDMETGKLQWLQPRFIEMYAICRRVGIKSEAFSLVERDPALLPVMKRVE